MFLIQDYANLFFWIGLYSITPLFFIIRFIGREQCKITENNSINFAFDIKPVFMYQLIGVISILCISFLALVIFTLVAPDIVETRCEYTSPNHYECQYIERNSLGLNSFMAFSKINSAKLINARQNDNSLFQLVLNVSDVRFNKQSILEQAIYKVKQIVNSFYVNKKADTNSDSLDLVFPIRIEKSHYKEWQSKIQSINIFTNKFTDFVLTIEQDANLIIQEKLGKKIYRDKNIFFDVGLIILRFFIFLGLAIYILAPRIECIADLEKNTFSIKRKRFLGVTTYKNQIQLDTINSIDMISSDDIDSIGTRLALELKSGGRVPITYVGEQGDRSRLYLCKSFRQWLKSESTPE